MITIAYTARGVAETCLPFGYIAEMTSAFVLAELGIVPTVRHADYIGAWIAMLKENKRAVFTAARLASQAADYLLGFRDGAEAKLATPLTAPETADLDA